MSGSFVRIYAHLVFGTKDRAPLLRDGIRERAWDYVGAIARNHGCTPVCIGGTADHVHALVQLPKDGTVPAVVRDLKANSSRWVRETFHELAGFAWQQGYGAFSVGVGAVGQVERYILNQDEHHRRETFEEEFVSFLERHGVEYDPEHLWR